MSRPSVSWVIPVSQVLWYWDNLGKLGLDTPNHVQGHRKSNPKSSAHHLRSDEALLLCQGYLRVQLHQFCDYLSIRAIYGSRAPKCLRIIWSNTWKVIQSLQLHISHQVKHYDSGKALWGLSFTCFAGVFVSGKLTETGPKYPKYCVGTHWVPVP